MDSTVIRERVQELRVQAADDPNGAGIEALWLFEDLLADEAQTRGFDRRGGMGTYLDVLKGHNFMSKEQFAQAGHSDLLIAMRGGTTALLVTKGGDPFNELMGIITVHDLLPGL